MSSSVCVVGTDATMVYDALHRVVAGALGDLDPAVALEDFTARDAAAPSGESVVPAVLEALYTPAFLVEPRLAAAALGLEQDLPRGPLRSHRHRAARGLARGRRPRGGRGVSYPAGP